MIKSAISGVMVFCLVSTMASALSISLAPTFNALDTNMTIAFTNHTIGINASFGTAYLYSVAGPSYDLQGNNITFYKPGNYTIRESVTNGGNYSISANSLITVAKPISVSIYPPILEDVANGQQPMQANVSGGTGPFTYQWYNDSGCTQAIANATGSQYTTGTLNQSRVYCVLVEDAYGKNATATADISVFQSLYTSQGEVLSVANHTALLAPSILFNGNNTYLVENVTPYALFHILFNLCGGNYGVYETGQTPSYVNISIENTSYNLMPNRPQSFGNGNCKVELLNISWIPIAQTSMLEFYYQPPMTTTISSTSTSSSTTSLAASAVLATTSTSTTPSSTSSILPSSPQAKPRGGDGWDIAVVLVIAVAMILMGYFWAKGSGRI